MEKQELIKLIQEDIELRKCLQKFIIDVCVNSPNVITEI